MEPQGSRWSFFRINASQAEILRLIYETRSQERPPRIGLADYTNGEETEQEYESTAVNYLAMRADSILLRASDKMLSFSGTKGSG
jgi:hypothetical protein